jgi:hypothetical protein
MVVPHKPVRFLSVLGSQGLNRTRTSPSLTGSEGPRPGSPARATGSRSSLGLPLRSAGAPGVDDDLLLVDSTPAECARSRETVKRPQLADAADYVYRRSRWSMPVALAAGLAVCREGWCNRGAEIRTRDLTDPNGARYQAAPRPDAGASIPHRPPRRRVSPCCLSSRPRRSSSDRYRDTGRIPAPTRCAPRDDLKRRPSHDHPTRSPVRTKIHWLLQPD